MTDAMFEANLSPAVYLPQIQLSSVSSLEAFGFVQLNVHVYYRTNPTI